MTKEDVFISLKQEKNLSKKELDIYYERIYQYLINSPHEGLSIGSLNICPLINPALRKLLTDICGYDINVEYETDINGLDAIYAHTHQSKMDHINFLASNPNHTILLNSSVLNELYKTVLRLNGVYFVNKRSKDSRFSAKVEMMRLMVNNKSITVFPESAWNLSPNKLHLPFYYGIFDIAQKSGKPIIPVVQEYIYDNSKLSGKEIVRAVNIRYGTPIFVGKYDDLNDKLEQFSNWISTTRFNLIESKGTFNRGSISNLEYINFLKGNIRNLQNAGIDINIERQGIFGATDDFYKYHNINDIPFDDENNLLLSDFTGKLKK